MATDIYFVSLHTGARSIHHVLPAWYLLKKGFSVVQCAPGYEDAALQKWSAKAMPQISGIMPCVKGKLGKLRHHLSFALQLAQLRRDSGGLFYVYGSVCTPAVAVSLAGIPGARLIYHTQDYLEPARYPVRCRIERHIAAKATLVVSNEINRARFMQSYYGLRSMPLVVPTALPREWPVPQRSEQARQHILAEKWQPDVKIILHQSPYAAVRMSPVLLEAVKQLPPDYLVLFTGMNSDMPSYEACMRHASALGIDKRLVVKPYVSFAELFTYTVNADIGILLYPNDGIGNFYQCPGRLTEYAAGGLPLVTSHFPGLEKLILKYDIGKTCDPYSPSMVAQAILSLGEVASPDARARAGKIRKLFEDHLAYEHGAVALVDRVRHLFPFLS